MEIPSRPQTQPQETTFKQKTKNLLKTVRDAVLYGSWKVSFSRPKSYKSQAKSYQNKLKKQLKNRDIKEKTPANQRIRPGLGDTQYKIPDKQRTDKVAASLPETKIQKPEASEQQPKDSASE